MSGFLQESLSVFDETLQKLKQFTNKGPNTNLTDEVMNYVLENLMSQFLKRLEINSETEMSMFINLNLLYC